MEGGSDMNRKIGAVFALAALLLVSSLTATTMTIEGSTITVTAEQESYKSSAKYKQVQFQNTHKKIKSKKLRSKDYSFSIIKKSGGGGVYADFYKGSGKYVSVSSYGGVIVRQNTPKGNYKVRVRVSTGGGYGAAIKILRIKVR